MNQNITKKRIITELVILSFLSLYIELLIIRWMSADMRAFTVFRTFPLITCFVGLGLGFALRKDDVFKHSLLAILLFCLTMIAANFFGVCLWGFPSLANFQWQNLVGLVSDPGWIYIFAFSLIVILLLAGPFAICVAIGGRLGVLFNQLPPLEAYCYNIGGAILGSLCFPVLCYMGWSPCQLLVPAALIIVFLSWTHCSQKLRVCNLFIALVLLPLCLITPEERAKPLIPELLKANCQRSTVWSPYQRIDLNVFFEDNDKNNDKGTHANASKQTNDPKQRFLGLELGANRAFYQYFFSKDALDSNTLGTTALLKNIKSDYALAFSFNNPKSALIVGAGTGQNVCSALEAGVNEIDAVEIDPVILDIGKQFNPDYGNSKVRLICDDARHYFSHTNKKYDVINFSTLDSHAVSGLGSSVRVDAYIYTKESIEKALSLLNDNGIILCSFATVAPWTQERLTSTFKQAAGYEPLCLEGKMIGTVYILGKPVKDKTLSLPKEYNLAKTPAVTGGNRYLTDDWPYLYVRSDIIDYPYLVVVAEIILLSVFAARRFLFSNQEVLLWQMFFLGAAFMTLELHAISFLSLLYGSTWVTSAIVIVGILVMILGANAMVIKFNKTFSRPPVIPYLVLFISILVSWCIPGNSFLSLGLAGYAISTFLTLLPMGLAAIVFACAFSRAKNISGALAFNLFGAVLGGLLEYLSNYWGIKSMMLVSMTLYALSAISAILDHRKLQKD